MRELTTGDLIEAVTPIWSARGGQRQVVGAVVVGTHVTERLEQNVRGISQAFLEYKQLKLLKNPIKGIYILLFLLMTLIVVFSFTWFALHLARGITGPIEQLAEGTREVAAGNLTYKVQTRGDDEIGVAGRVVQPDDRRPRRSPSDSSRRPTSTCRTSTPSWRTAGATSRRCWRRSPPAWCRSTRSAGSRPSTAPPPACSA